MRGCALIVVLCLMASLALGQQQDWPVWKPKVLKNMSEFQSNTNALAFLEKVMAVFVRWIDFESGGLREMTWAEAEDAGWTWADMERTRTLPLAWQDVEVEP